jgi:hypothetical protein
MSVVTMNQHKWGTEKTDVQTTNEVKQQKNASGRAGKYKVNLANGFENELQTLTRPMSRAYHYYLRAAMPWKAGERALANTQLIEFLTEMQLHDKALKDAKLVLAPKLPALIQKAVALNGDLGDPADYPSPQSILDAYSFNFDFEPVPTADAFGNLPEGFEEKFADNYSNKVRRRLREGIEDTCLRVQKLVKDFRGVIARDKPKFFQSTLDNIEQLTQTLRNTNAVVGDGDINDLTAALALVTGYSAEQLRLNESARIAVSASCTASLAALAAVLNLVVEEECAVEDAAPGITVEEEQLDLPIPAPPSAQAEPPQEDDDGAVTLGALIPELAEPVPEAPVEEEEEPVGSILEQVANMPEDELVPADDEEDTVDPELAALFSGFDD